MQASWQTVLRGDEGFLSECAHFHCEVRGRSGGWLRREMRDNIEGRENRKLTSLRK